MAKFIIFLLILAVSFAVVLPVEASSCRYSGDRSICILTIKRSAKNYWEYRAVVSVDGVEKPIEVYNCRDRVKLQKDGTAVPFERDAAGDFVCRLFKR
jgi:biopolymer transport protein ExbD